MKNIARPKVVVLGGGFGGLESALYLRTKMPDQADITLISDQDYFLFKPNTIYIPFGLDPKKLRFRLAGPTRRKDIHFSHTRAREIDPVSRTVYTDAGKQGYDFLVVATGLAPSPGDVPGLAEFGQIAWTAEAMLNVRAALHRIFAEAKDGKRRHVLFMVPPDNVCAGPLYEMVMMLDSWLRRKKVRHLVDISLSTYESRYVQAFGERMHDIVAEEFGQRGITGHTSATPLYIEPQEAFYAGGLRVPFDLLVAFPPYVASETYHHLPVDSRGFVSVDSKTRQVPGYPEVYAVGDATDIRIKQAFLAFLQADAAADHLAAQVLSRSPEFDFEQVSLSMTDSLERSLTIPPDPNGPHIHSSPDIVYEKFADLPHSMSGTDSSQFAVRPDGTIDAAAAAMYRVGSSPIWRLGKMALGIYLPWRFKVGNPFYAGLPWKGMEASLRAVTATTPVAAR